MDENRKSLKIARDSYLFVFLHGLSKKNKNDKMRLEEEIL